MTEPKAGADAYDVPFIIATNAYGAVKPYYAKSLAKTLLHWHACGAEKLPEVAIIDGVYVPEARNELLRGFIAHGLHLETAGILWIEQDHEWIPEDVVALLETAARRPSAIVGALYMHHRQEKVIIGHPLAWPPPVAEADGWRAVAADHVGFGFTWTPWSVFVPVDGAHPGLGAVATKPLPQPWFETGWDRAFSIENPGDLAFPRFVTDDVYFCRKARAAGIEILACLDCNVGHGYEPGPRTLKSAGVPQHREDPGGAE